MPEWVSQGTHRFQVDGDLLVIEVHGLFTEQDARLIYRFSDPMAEAYGYVLSIFDARGYGGITPEARRYIGEQQRIRIHIVGATAVVSASFIVRTLATLLNHAGRLFGRPETPLHFCASPEEAQEWIAAQRPGFAAVRSERRG
jgi:hypothetical protein